MKSLRASTTLASLLLGILLLQPGYSDDKSTEKKGATDAPPKIELKRRLPDHFGKLGLTTEQREKVVAIQAKYGPQIAELENQIKKLREKQTAEIRTVLNADQKDQLNKLTEEANKKKSATAAANEKPVSANGSEKKDAKKKDK